MTLLAAAGAALSIGSSIMGFNAAQDAKKNAKHLLRASLQQHDMDAAYNEEQKRKEQEQQLGLVDSIIGSSNIQFSGSVMSYRREVKDQLKKEMNYLTKTNEIQRKVIKLGGKAEIKSLGNQAIGSLLSGASSALGWYK